MCSQYVAFGAPCVLADWPVCRPDLLLWLVVAGLWAVSSVMHAVTADRSLLVGKKRKWPGGCGPSGGARGAFVCAEYGQGQGHAEQVARRHAHL